MQHDPVVFLVLPVEHGFEFGFQLVQSNVSDETQSPLVDANQRNTVRCQLATKPQHGAIAADHQRQIALGTNAMHVQGRCAV